MNDKVLSIVVPSYNAEKFLNKGIPTFMDERIMPDIEVIIVDDGAKDKTPQMADEFKEKYPDVITVIHKANGGHGSTINAGIEVAQGKYFCVVDADDWVDTEEFVKIVQKIKQGNSDLYLGQAKKVDPDGNVLGYEKVTGLPYDEELSLPENLNKAFRIEMHNYFIRTSILREHKIKCHEHHFYVDIELVLYSLIYVKTVTVCNEYFYQYLIGRDGQSLSVESRRKNAQQYVDVIFYLIDFYLAKRYQMTLQQKQHYEKRIANFASGYYGTLLGYKNNHDKKIEMRKFDAKLKERSIEVYKGNCDACIWLLRKSNFASYGISSLIYRYVNRKYMPD